MGFSTEDIIKRASQCLKKGIKKVSAEVALGIAWYEKGDTAEAVRHYQRALELEPECVEAHTGLGISLARTGDTDQSRIHLEKAWQISQNSSLLANWLADAYFDQGQLDLAIELYNEALRLDASDSNAQNDMADAYRLKGDYETALQMYDRAIAIDPGDTNAMLEKAQCLVQLQRVDEAMQNLKALIEKFPASRDSATAMVVYASLLLKHGESAEALEWFERSLAFFPFNRQVLFQAAICAYSSADNKKSLQYLKKILELDPSDARAAAMIQKVSQK